MTNFNYIEYAYLSRLEQILRDGEDTADRTGTGTLQLFGNYVIAHNMSEGFPLLTTKKVFFRGVIEELLWFLRGDTNVNSLRDKGVHIWDGNAKDRPSGEMGPIYGEQMRAWGAWEWDDEVCQHVWRTYDQIENLVSDIKAVKADASHPAGRRLIVNLWHVDQLAAMALPPCHCFFQCHVRGGEWLDLQMYQRSADMFLGVPFNIASYGAMLMLLAMRTGLKPGMLYITFGNTHIYKNHVDQVREQLEREPRPLPTLTIDPHERWEDYRFEDFHLEGYDPYPAIKGEMSV